jgi:glycosyltransferase involved in cell wall biosynthesis
MLSDSDRRPVVTIVTPTYNHADFIGDCLASALAQTFTDWELVVVDDGSSDATLEVARRFDDPRISVVVQEHRGLERLAETYAAASASSASRLVAILEGDDTWPPDKLARQVPDFDDPDVVLSYGAAELIDDRGCVYATVGPSIPRAARNNQPRGAIISPLLGSNPIIAPTVVIRRSALDAIGGFWQPAGVPYIDHPTWLRLALEGAFVCHDEIVGHWRRHAAQWTTANADSIDGPLPRAAYVAEAAAMAMARGVPLAPGPSARHDNRHTDRALTNRWRLALIAGRLPSVAATFLTLVRTAKPRLVVIALIGLASWAVGSDLEWLQRHRRRVSWPSRRHLRSHRRDPEVKRP